ncbi:hypothetical protein BDN72DRAFT_905316 [Pluteus cervinus]|uniref:Uncharacterized protein n=1 Tax=Pluteus cervinus TaxID=181527 RepID=A0ACD3A2I8_9AGAR|nr:hypothetical protein BDN72DRAFT_905316 [Pluteus cervinus]
MTLTQEYPLKRVPSVSVSCNEDGWLQHKRRSSIGPTISNLPRYLVLPRSSSSSTSNHLPYNQTLPLTSTVHQTHLDCFKPHCDMSHTLRVNPQDGSSSLTEALDVMMFPRSLRISLAPDLIQHSGRATPVDGGFIYSPNSQRDVKLPWSDVYGDAHESLFDFKDSSAAAYHYPFWWTCPWGWLAFVPLNPDFASFPFDSLPAIPQYLPKSEAGYYYLPQDLVVQWKYLEGILYHGTSTMNQQIQAPLVRPFAPSAYGYEKTFKSPRAARRAMFKAAEWFSIWGAIFSYLVAHGQDKAVATAHLKYTKVPFWYDILSSHHYDGGWLRGIQTHQMCKFDDTVERAGCFIKLLSKHAMQPAPEWFIKWNIPIWYMWTPAEIAAAKSDPYLQSLAPPSHTLQEATTYVYKEVAPQAVSASPLQAIASSLPHAPTSTESVLGVVEYPWEAYIKNQHYVANMMKDLESTQAKDLREARELQPPTTGCQVWQWRRDPFTSKYRRFLVRKKNVTTTLQDYDVDHKVYLAAFNEWHLWPMVQQEDIPNDSSEHDLEQGPSDYNPENIAPPLENELPSSPNEAVFAYSEPPDLIQDEATQMLSHFCGYIAPSSHESRPDVELSIKRHSFYHYIGLSSPTRGFDVYTTSHAPSMVDFLTKLIENQIPPPHIWDLSTTAARQVRFEPFFNKIQRLGSLFIIDFGSERLLGGILAVTSAADALTVCRFDSTLNDFQMAKLLVGHGIPIRILKHLPVYPTGPSPQPQRLPIYLENETITKQDYEIWVHQRDAFLTTPRGQTALRVGGFIWRTALDACNIHDTLAVPQTWQSNPGFAINDPQDANFAYYDVQFTEYELRFLCGTYECYTGNGDQTTYLSWWPSYWDFEKSGYNWRHWTPQDEIKYQTRLDEISKNGHPLSAKHWQQRLQGKTATSKIRKNYGRMANEFLQNLGK